MLHVAGGEDRTLRRALSGSNPQGARVTIFERLTELELTHDARGAEVAAQADLRHPDRRLDPRGG